MKYTLYRSFEEMGSPHRAIGTFSVQELQEMASRGELHVDYWIQEKGMLGDSHRIDRFGPLFESNETLVKSGSAMPELPRPPAKEATPLDLLRSQSHYESVRNLVAITAGILLTMTAIASLVTFLVGIGQQSIGLVCSALFSGIMGCLLILVAKHALTVLIDIADILFQQQASGSKKSD